MCEASVKWHFNFLIEYFYDHVYVKSLELVRLCHDMFWQMLDTSVTTLPLLHYMQEMEVRWCFVLQKRNRYYYDSNSGAIVLCYFSPVSHHLIPLLLLLLLLLLVTMVVMSQLYLCDEPYWSRFHVTEPPPTPSIHVISDGKMSLAPKLCHLLFGKNGQNWLTSSQNEIISGLSTFTKVRKGLKLKFRYFNINVNFLEKLKQQVEEGY